MGQNLSNQLEEIKEDIVKGAHTLKDLMDISYEELVDKIKEVNEILKQSSDGRRLEFKIKEGTDTTFLWKQTIKIICIRHFEATGKNVIYKVLNLRQFLLGFKMIFYHIGYKQDTSNTAGANLDDSCDLAKQFSASMILDEILSEPNADSDDCIICMERKPEVTLPCTHAYCLVCIEQWNVSNKTCPVCRETVENTNESWVTPDIPNSTEINAEVQKALTELTLNLPSDDD